MKSFVVIFLIFHFLSYSSLPIQNWSRNYQCCPTTVFKPSNLQELVHCIKKTIQEKKHIRAFGSLHAFNNSAMVESDDYLIDTSHLNRIIEINSNHQQVKVEGGILIKDLQAQLALNNLELPIISFIADQTIAGATCTATHGACGPTMAEAIRAITLVDGKGNVHHIDAIQDPELFKAAQVSLGALGIIYDVTLQCVPLSLIEHKNTLTTLEEIINNYDDYLNRHDVFWFFANPYTNKQTKLHDALTVEWNYTTQLPSSNNAFIKAMNKANNNTEIAYHPDNITFARLAFQEDHSAFCSSFLTRFNWPCYINYGYQVRSPLNAQQAPKSYDTEIIVNKTDIKEAVKEIHCIIDEYEKRGIVFPLFFVYRSINATCAYLSPACDQDKIAISIVIVRFFDKEYDFNESYGMQLFNDLEAMAIEKFKSRPHWGKIHFLDAQKMKKIYGSNVDLFNTVRLSFDPQGIFLNEPLKRIFC